MHRSPPKNNYSNANASTMLRDSGGYNAQKSWIQGSKRQQDSENSRRSYKCERKCPLALSPSGKSTMSRSHTMIRARRKGRQVQSRMKTLFFAVLASWREITATQRLVAKVKRRECLTFFAASHCGHDGSPLVLESIHFGAAHHRCFALNEIEVQQERLENFDASRISQTS